MSGKAYLRCTGEPGKGLCNTRAVLLVNDGMTVRLRCNVGKGHPGRHEFSQDDAWTSEKGQEMSSSTRIRWGTVEQQMRERAGRCR